MGTKCREKQASDQKSNERSEKEWYRGGERVFLIFKYIRLTLNLNMAEDQSQIAVSILL